ncbi:MAG: selenocysteine-specific translation elongation factor [Dissulfuribacterales bacterium]
MRDSIIIAVAGHVKHGKTSLVKLLTGSELNRHPDEQRRGITITPGHAVLRLSDGKTVFFIDLPGHKEFLHNTIRGLWGIDAAILVIAANEGVMPQTREHLNILQLLGVARLICVITKIDCVEQELLELAMVEAAELLKSTPYTTSPILQVSSITLKGREGLMNSIRYLFDILPTPDLEQPFVLAIDHILHKKGHGLVVTGSVSSGTLTQEDVIEIQPLGIRDRVRAIQAGGRLQSQIYAGMRAGLNLASLHANDIATGYIACTPDTLPKGRFLNVELYTPAQIPSIKSYMTAKLFIGTMQTNCKIILMNTDWLHANERGLAQLRLETAIAIPTNSPFVLVSLHKNELLSGGRVLEISNRKWRKRWNEHGNLLQTLATGDLLEIIPTLMHFNPLTVLTTEKISILSGYPLRIVKDHLMQLCFSNTIRPVGNGYFLSTAFDAIQNSIYETVLRHHATYSEQEGIALETLRAQFAHLPIMLFEEAINGLITTTRLDCKNGLVLQRGFNPKFNRQFKELMQLILKTAEKSWIMPITLHGILKTLPVSEVEITNAFNVLTRQNKLIKIYKSKMGKREEYLTPKALEYIKDTITNFFRHNKELTMEDAKKLFPIGRRIINILDYLDSISFTLFDKKQMKRIQYPHLNGSGCHMEGPI